MLRELDMDEISGSEVAYHSSRYSNIFLGHIIYFVKQSIKLKS